jgi:hypothetical protein
MARSPVSSIIVSSPLALGPLLVFLLRRRRMEYEDTLVLKRSSPVTLGLALATPFLLAAAGPPEAAELPGLTPLPFVAVAGGALPQAGVELEVVEPNAGRPGTEMVLTVRGQGFNRFSSIQITEGIEAGPTEFVNTRELRVPIFILPEAPPGPRDVVHQVRESAPGIARLEMPPPVILRGGFTVLEPTPQEPRRVRVPPLVERFLEEAELILTEAQLELGGVTEEPSDAEAGMVLRQEPEAGMVVRVGTPVRVWVSQGRPPVEIHRLDPSSALPGSELSVEVFGSGFERASEVSIEGVFIDAMRFVSPEELRLGIVISPDSPPGARDVVYFGPGAQEAVLEGGFTVEEPVRVERPDLAPAPLDWEADAERQVLEIYLSVQNLGGARSRPFAVEVRTSATGWIETEEFDELDAGDDAEVVLAVPIRRFGRVGSVDLVARVDPDDRIPEENEENNVASATIRLPTDGEEGEQQERDGLPIPPLALLGAALVGIAGIAGVAWLWRARSRAEPPPIQKRVSRREAEATGPDEAEAPATEEAEPTEEEVEAEPTTEREPEERPPDEGPDATTELPITEATTVTPPAADGVSTEEGPRVRFTAFHPKETAPDQWSSLLVYVHVPGVEEEILEDSRARLAERASEYGERRGEATRAVARGAGILAVPELAGFRFNPPSARFLWLEDWHYVNFRMQAVSGTPGLELGTAINGRVAFFVGPILIGEVKIWTYLAESDQDLASVGPGRTTGDAFRRIFPSYSHVDVDIVEELKSAYRAIGDQFLQDVDVLRSGEEWNAALLEKIDEADVFQLYWSETARRSRYVEQEWRHALGRDIPNFIRPLYWKQPLAPIPQELAGLHFHYLDFVRG